MALSYKSLQEKHSKLEIQCKKVCILPFCFCPLRTGGEGWSFAEGQHP